MAAEFDDGRDVGFDGARRVVADLQVFDEASAQSLALR